MKRVFTDRGTKQANSLTELQERMIVLGATLEECGVVRTAVGAFFAGRPQRSRVADREAGMREVQGRLEDERYQAVKAALTA
jgi:hypothetical protein